MRRRRRPATVSSTPPPSAAAAASAIAPISAPVKGKLDDLATAAGLAPPRVNFVPRTSVGMPVFDCDALPGANAPPADCPEVVAAGCDPADADVWAGPVD